MRPHAPRRGFTLIELLVVIAIIAILAAILRGAGSVAAWITGTGQPAGGVEAGLGVLLNPGDPAPNFTAQDQNGQTHQLADYRGQRVALYFYPKDDTPGCTAQAITALAAETGLTVERRGFGVAEALAAREAMLTSASNFVLPIVRIDGQPVGDGRPGPVARRLRALYVAAAQG